jgi:hypothetical protein
MVIIQKIHCSSAQNLVFLVFQLSSSHNHTNIHFYTIFTHEAEILK